MYYTKIFLGPYFLQDLEFLDQILSYTYTLGKSYLYSKGPVQT